MSKIMGDGWSLKNFGDYTNDIMFRKLSGKNILTTHIIDDIDSVHYLCTGSILRLCNEKHIVMGAGFISEDDVLGGGEYLPQDKNMIKCKPFKILSVRGPLTKKKLLDMGIYCGNIFLGDPLIIFPLIYNPKLIVSRQIGLLPHYIDKNKGSYVKHYEFLKNNFDVELIDILCGDEYEKMIDQIVKSEYIISSSLHGVIMGIVYGKKTIFVNYGYDVIGNNFKFQDFFESISCETICVKGDDLYDYGMMESYIRYDVENILKIGYDIVDVCPFFDLGIKELHKKNWEKHCRSILPCLS